MQKNHLVPPREAGAALLAAGFLLLFTGCGDAHTFGLEPGSIDPDSVGLEHACFDGSDVTLMRYASTCNAASKSLDSVVHDGLVFPADDVGTLESPCSDGPTPAIDVLFDMESGSVILDFSQVARSGRFPEAEFDGYVLEVSLEESNGTLLAVAIDTERSTLVLDPRDVAWDHSRIDLNFEGERYDTDSVLTLDLTFARLSPP